MSEFYRYLVDGSNNIQNLVGGRRRNIKRIGDIAVTFLQFTDYAEKSELERKLTFIHKEFDYEEKKHMCLE